MKRNNFISKIAVIAAAALTMSLGTGFTVSAAAGEVAIDAANFPYNWFRFYIENEIDTNKDKVLSAEEISSVTEIDFSSRSGTSSLKGIEFFTNLEVLDCSDDDLKELDLSKNTALKELYCFKNNFEKLDLSKNTALELLGCSENNLEKLDLSNNKALKKLECANNKLTQLNVSGCTDLTYLYCYGDTLTKLDVSGCTALTELSYTAKYSHKGNLTQLNVSGCTALTSLDCGYNNLTQLDMSGCTSLKSLSCGNNNLTQLDMSGCTALTSLYCGYNNLTDLDLSNNTALKNLNCYNNNLTQLDVNINTALETLDCDNNSLTHLDVSKNVALKTLNCDNNSLTHLDVSKNVALKTLDCGNNSLTHLDVSGCTSLTSLDCDYNSLTHLDVSGCTSLTSLYCSNNSYDIGEVSGEYDLNKLSGFDPTKTSNWKGATLKDGKLTEFDGSGTVSYSYDCGKNFNFYRTFNLKYKLVGELFDKENGVRVKLPNKDVEGMSLDVKDITATENVILNNAVAVKVYNIALKKGGAEIQPTGAISITIPVSEKVNVEKAKIFRKSDGSFTDMNAVYDPQSKKLSFETGSLGIFVVANSTVGEVAIDEKNFPDENFRKYVSGIDTDKNGWLSDSEISNKTTMSVINKEISSLKGIEYFTALKELYCYNNNLTELDVSNFTALTTLYCYNNALTKLNVSGCAALTYLQCDSNNLTTLDLSKCTALKKLYCYDNNNLTTLDVSKCTALTLLWCYNTKLTTLDVSGFAALTELQCYNNNLTQLNVSNCAALTYLKCYNNNLTHLDVSSCTALKTLYCYDNSYDIGKVRGEYDLNKLSGFDPTKVRTLSGATLKDGKLTEFGSSGTISYSYDCGKSKTATFTLKYEIVGEFLDEASGVKINLLDEDGDGMTLYVTDITATESVNINNAAAVQVYNIALKNGDTVTTPKGSILITIPASQKVNAEKAKVFRKETNGTFTDMNAVYNSQSKKLSFKTDRLGIYVVANSTAGEVAINSTNFPDDIFRAYVKETFDTDKNEWLSDSEISKATTISIGSKGISSLKGIEFFTALDNLYCGDNNLETLDVSNCTALTILNCDNNKLTKLDVSKNTALTGLGCSGNNLTTLDVSKNTALISLGFDNNKLTQIDVSNNTALMSLRCDNNNLKTLNVSNCRALTNLHCENTNLTQLDVRNCTALIYLRCSDNNFTQLNVSNCAVLKELYCNNDNLTTLDLSNCAALEELYCNNNKLTQLDLSNCATLRRLYCDNNSLAYLDASRNTVLDYFSCKDNCYDIGKVHDEYDLKKLDGFDPTKASSWYGATLKGDKLTEFDGNGVVKYFYECRNDIRFKIVFTLKYQKAEALIDEASGIRAELSGEYDEKISLNVTDVTKTENVSVNGAAAVRAYDIALKKDGAVIQPSGDVKITIPVPENVDGAKAKVFRKEADGTFTDMNAVYDTQSKTLGFATDKSGVYAIVDNTVQFVQGDVNHDGELTPRDLTILGKAYMQEAVTAEQIAIADMDGNDRITPKDITALGKLYMSMQK